MDMGPLWGALDALVCMVLLLLILGALCLVLKHRQAAKHQKRLDNFVALRWCCWLCEQQQQGMPSPDGLCSAACRRKYRQIIETQEMSA